MRPSWPRTAVVLLVSAAEVAPVNIEPGSEPKLNVPFAEVAVAGRLITI